MSKEQAAVQFEDLTLDLIKIGTGEIEHTFRGHCPDATWRPSTRDWRDRQCPACVILDRATLWLSGLVSLPADVTTR